MSSVTLRRPRISRRTLRNWIAGYLFILPVVLGLVIWTMYPMAMSIYYSFTKYELLTPPHWVGLRNYARIFTDPVFWTSARVTFVYSIIVVPLQLVASGLLALLLHRPLPGMSLYRAIFYIPVVVPPLAAAVLFSDLFDIRFGIANFLLHAVGLPESTWLTRPETALKSLILMSMWGIGGGTIIWLAGLQNIPRILYEAAEVDGAGMLHRFWHVTLPMLTPVIFFNLIMQLIGSLQSFIGALVMTDGGPANATLFMVFDIYREGFKHFHMGIAAAMAWVLFVVIGLLTWLLFRTSSWVFYGGDQA